MILPLRLKRYGIRRLRNMLVPGVLVAAMTLVAACGTERSRALSALWNINRGVIDSIAPPDKERLEAGLDSLMQMKTEVPDTLVGSLLFEVADYLFNHNEFKKLINYVKDTEPLMRRIAGSSPTAQAQLVELRTYIYETYREVGLLDRAAQGLLSELDNARKLGLDQSLALLYNNLSTIYINQGLNDKAIELGQVSVKLNEELNDSNFLVINYSNLSSAYLAKKQYDKAIEYSFVALHYITPSDSLLRMMVQRNISTKYTHMQEYQLAIRQLKPVMAFFERNNIERELPLTYEKYGRLLWKTGRTDEALKYYRKAYLDKHFCRINQRMDIARSYADFCDSIGDYANEREAIRYCLLLNDTLGHGFEGNQADMLARLYQGELDRSNDNAQRYQTAQNTRRVIIIVLNILLLSALATLAVLFVRRKNEQKAWAAHDEERTQQLQAASLAQTRSNELIKKLSSELQDLQQTLRSAPKSDTMTALQRITSKVAKADSDKADSDSMQVANADFFKRLLESYPQLTSNDLRLAAMLRQGLSTKEIAEITIKEVRSIDTARNRLRKKMGITPEEDLCKFFMRI